MTKLINSFVSNKSGSVSAEFVILAACLAMAAGNSAQVVGMAAMDKANAIQAEIATEVIIPQMPDLF